jgi:fluoride exporter
MGISIYFWVALGGALGSMGRYWIGIRIATMTGLAFPWATILINILGSLAIGFLARFTGPEGLFPTPLDVRTFLMVGLCGGFTTFSAFSLQTLILAGEGRWLLAGANILLSVALCLIAVALGHWLATLFGGFARS